MSLKSFVILCLLILIILAYGVGRYTKTDTILEYRLGLIACQAELISTKADLRRALMAQTDFKKDYLQRKYLDIYAFEQVVEIENQR